MAGCSFHEDGGADCLPGMGEGLVASGGGVENGWAELSGEDVGEGAVVCFSDDKQETELITLEGPLGREVGVGKFVLLAGDFCEFVGEEFCEVAGFVCDAGREATGRDDPEEK